MASERHSSASRKHRRGALRIVFDSAEHVIASQLEPVVQSPIFSTGLGIVKSVDASLRNATEQRSRRLLHALNLPAASDIRRLHQHLAAVEDRICDLVAEQAEDDREPTRP